MAAALSRPKSPAGLRGLIAAAAALAAPATLAAPAAALDFTPPTLAQIQTAISDSSAAWTADTSAVWNETWANTEKRLGCLFPSAPPSADSPLPALEGLRDDLPAAFDWRSKEGRTYVSPVKNQSTCGSCWAFAACGAFESLRKIKGYSTCGFENLSEQFVVSCCDDNLGCDGGYPDETADFLMDHGTVGEACFTYQAKDSTGGVPCSNRCEAWASWIRQIDDWSHVRNSWYASASAIDSMKTALLRAPLWTTMRVPADFKAYDSGVYRHVLGPVLGGHAILVVGWNDTTSCFICKNSWGSDWGENGYFRIAYSQVHNRVRFGAFTIEYELEASQPNRCFCYQGDAHAPFEWVEATQAVQLTGNEQVADLLFPFGVKYFCHYFGLGRLSSNGWMALGAGSYEPCPSWAPIPSPIGPGNMIAPLWTDLDPSQAPPGGGIFTRDTGDGRFVIEYREIPRHTGGPPETFEMILYDPSVYPTPTGDAIVKFQYAAHDPALQGHTVGIENETEECGVQIWYAPGEAGPAGPRDQTPILPGMAIEFTAVPNGDEDPPESPTDLTVTWQEPCVHLEWTNPAVNTAGFDLEFLSGAVVTVDGAAVAAFLAEPGAPMSYDHRGAAPGLHQFGVWVYVGEQASQPVALPWTVPTPIDHADHDTGQLRFTVTDQGICGFTDGGQSTGSGFVYGQGGENALFLGSLWAGTDSLYALNHDYDDDPYADWLYRHDCEGPCAGVSDQDILAEYDDGGHFAARGLRVQQESWAWGGAPHDDFVILHYTLTNAGEETIAGLYVGQYMDWDLTGVDPWHNQGATAPDLRLAYMHGGASDPYVGVALLDSVPVELFPAANLALVHNPTFVYPQAYLLDADRSAFLRGADPAHAAPASWEENDWSVLVSAGPYDLAPGATQIVAFAILAGDDEADLRANVLHALEKVPALPADVAADPAGPTRLQLYAGRPNPFTLTTSIRYALPRSADVDLAVFDLLGRRLCTLAHGARVGGVHTLHWDGVDGAGRRAPAGVYFCRLDAGAGVQVRRLMILPR